MKLSTILRMPRRLAGLFAVASLGMPCSVSLADPLEPAEFVVSDQVQRPAEKTPPLGANDWGRSGSVEWAANNFIRNAGNEPVYWRNLHRVVNCGPNWLEIDGPGTSWFQLWNSGFLSGAEMRIYRLVDKSGATLPLNASGKYLDLAKADHVQFVGHATVLPEGSAGYPEGGWIANAYAAPVPNGFISQGNLCGTDINGLENGKTYWYTVTALGPGGIESAIANEVSVTPRAGVDAGPHILNSSNDDPLPAKAGAQFRLTPKAFGGASPLRWEILDAADRPLELPKGLKFDPASGALTGRLASDDSHFQFTAKVTDARGRSDRRMYSSEPAPASTTAARTPPAPPTQVSAAVGDGCVTVSWKPSPSANVIGYRIKRSTAPADRQTSRVVVAPGAPALEKFDYVVVSKKMDPFQMRWVNPRVRGLNGDFDAPEWYWHSNGKTCFLLTPHPQPIPPEMLDPGETCLEVRAAAGAQRIEQIVFIGTEQGGESIWYGQLEPGKNYRLEVWLRQEGLADNASVTFSYGKSYPGISQTFHVTGQWKKYTYDFQGPPRPARDGHFGHGFSMTGPGTLWMDNARIFRWDSDADKTKPYAPNQTVLQELLASQPEQGPKGMHRDWILQRDATMSSILSWHANSRVAPDWNTNVSETMQMTLPMALSFDLATGATPQTRTRPWLVIQHILHSEQDWQNLIEYLAAPYDPAKDTPQAKPWAYRRYQQRGVGTPWIDEFAEIAIEFGNETWHNGVFPDWLGFNTRNAVWQGGPEYGLFTRYLIEQMRQSPYWKAQNLDKKLRFCLGAGYPIDIKSDGTIVGYGEEAMQKNPYATLLGHANYVGPKWETGDKSSGVFDDHGVQEVMLSFLTGPEQPQIKMGKARDVIARAGHDYDIVAYEGGPSGYALPGRDTPAQRETNEKYGKSLAMAVASLDSWMRSYAYGWTYQNFLGYGQGRYWNSHTPLWDGFRPSPGWEALALRNRHASGDLMTVAEKRVPTLAHKVGKEMKELPLAGCYAMRDGSRWSVFVVSRKLDGAHDGADFADGCTPVGIQLPFKTAAKITLFALQGDPRANNIKSLAIATTMTMIPARELTEGRFVVNEATGGKPHGLPPGSIFLYVFEGTK